MAQDDLDPTRLGPNFPPGIVPTPHFAVQGQGQGQPPMAVTTTTYLRKRRAWLILSAAGLIAILAIGFWYRLSNGPVTSHYKTAPIERSPITVLISARKP